MDNKSKAIAEILTLLEERTQIDQEGFTIKELMKLLGCGEGKVNKIIDELMEKDWLCCVRLPRVNRAGIYTTIIGYKLTKKAQDKAAAQS